MINRKMKAETKLTVVMWSRKFGKRTTAPSSGCFRRRRPTCELPVYLSRHVCCSNFGIGEVWWMRQSYPAAKHLTIFIRNGLYFRPSKHRVSIEPSLLLVLFISWRNNGCNAEPFCQSEEGVFGCIAATKVWLIHCNLNMTLIRPYFRVRWQPGPHFRGVESNLVYVNNKKIFLCCF